MVLHRCRGDSGINRCDSTTNPLALGSNLRPLSGRGEIREQSCEFEKKGAPSVTSSRRRITACIAPSVNVHSKLDLRDSGKGNAAVAAKTQWTKRVRSA